MNPAEQPLRFDDLSPLLAALCDGAIGDDALARLKRLLAADPKARRWYIAYMDLHGDLCWNHFCRERPPRDGSWAGGQDFGEAAGGGQLAADRGAPAPADRPPSSAPPIVVDLSPATHTPFWASFASPGGFLFSYVMSALILGIGLLVGWAWRTSHDRQTVQHAAIRSPAIIRPTPEKPVVGRITDMVDCRWSRWTVVSGRWTADSESEIPNQKSEIGDRTFFVPLGAKFAVTSGLMEITYDTGAKVILQAPATYEVESDRSGYLSLGMLTARIEKEASEVRGQESGSRGERTANPVVSQTGTGPTTSLAPSPSPLSPLPSPLFSVRTPTAVVADLGTEFGVEVEPSGASLAHVFRGSVEFRSAQDGSSARPIRLGANESARAQIGANRVVAVIREKDRAGAPPFVRLMPKPASVERSHSGVVPAAAPSYRLTDLGTLGGATSRAYDINAAGQVVGSSDLAGGVPHAFLYSGGKMKDLDPAGAGASYAFRVNNSGKIVGAAKSSEQRLSAFLYCDGKLTYLERANTLASTACGINSSGIIVGVVTESSGVAHAFRNDGVLSKPSLLVQSRSWVTDINDRDQAVGYASKAQDVMRAFVHDGKAMKELCDLGGGSSYATHINGLGQVAGYCDVPGGNTHAVLWDAAAVHDLGTLGGRSSRAEGVNNRGQVVGTAHGGSGDARAFLCANGVMSDLNALIPPDSGWTLQIARAINDSGLIVGDGTAPDGNTRAFLLTPIVPRASGLQPQVAPGRERRGLPTN
jgi:probable HAF family extracellular repeat protein